MLAVRHQSPSQPRRRSRPLTMLFSLLMVLGGLFPAGLPDLAAAPVTDTASGAIVAQDDPETSNLSLTAFTCAASDLPEGDSLTADDHAEACTTPVPNLTFHLIQDDEDTATPTDQQGKVRFEFPAGAAVRFYAGVPLEANEVLFCTVGDPAVATMERVTIDAEGVSTFTNAAAETRTCAWYVVQPDAEEAGATEIPSATEIPPAPPVSTDEANFNESSFTLLAFTCAFNAVADPASVTYNQAIAACPEIAPGVTFHLNTGDANLTETTGDNGRTSFAYPVGDEVEFYAAVPLESTELLFCSLSGGTPFSVSIDQQGVFHWDNAEREQRTCSWFLVDDAPPETEIPATEIPATEIPPTVIPETEIPGSASGSIAVFPLACPADYQGGVDQASLAEACADGAPDVSFSLGDEGGTTVTRVSNGVAPLVWADLPAGSYSLFSSVPLEAATEYLFCAADGGSTYQKEFSAQGVTSFVGLETEQIDCTWFIVPTNDRGDETGASLEIHLATCPVDFTGDDIFETCHHNGLAGYEFTIDGPDGEQTATTVVYQQNGPGVVAFTSLAAGNYTIIGGPPGDFGTVSLYCSTQPDRGTPDYGIDGVIGWLNLGENEHVLCDWYFLPEDGRGQTPTPTPTATPTPARAEILVTLFACPAGESGAYGGATLSQFQQRCTEKVNDVTFRLGAPNGVPITAKTGISGAGAVRFYDLLPGNLTLTPSLPATMTSAAVFCTIGNGNPYQKALANGGTTFVDVDGESIACSWFAVKRSPPPVDGPTGSITIREYLCEKDRSEITDWDADCTPGSTGTSFSIANTATGAALQGTPGQDGVYVFRQLPDGFYTLTQAEGRWCRAVADRVDSQSRVIVQGGGNTDVVLYQCNAVSGLPITGSGSTHLASPSPTELDAWTSPAAMLGVVAPLASVAAWLHRRLAPNVTVSGDAWRAVSGDKPPVGSLHTRTRFH